MVKHILILLMIGVLVSPSMSQTYEIKSENNKLEILGTSTIHDWEIVAEEMTGKASINLEGDNLTIGTLEFQVPVKSLKSGKSSMDNNTYEALKSKEYSNITYSLKNMELLNKKDKEYNLKTAGVLTIAGVPKTVNMQVIATEHLGYVSFAGKLDFKMTDFKVDPPTALMGTIKTGDEVSIVFNVAYNR